MNSIILYIITTISIIFGIIMLILYLTKSCDPNIICTNTICNNKYPCDPNQVCTSSFCDSKYPCQTTCDPNIICTKDICNNKYPCQISCDPNNICTKEFCNNKYPCHISCDPNIICTKEICDNKYPCQMVCEYINPKIIEFNNKSIRYYNGTYMNPNDINRSTPSYNYKFSYINENLFHIKNDGTKLALRFPGTYPTYAQLWPIDGNYNEKFIYDGYNFFFKGPSKIKLSYDLPNYIDYEFGKNDFVMMLAPSYISGTTSMDLILIPISRYVVGRPITLKLFSLE